MEIIDLICKGCGKTVKLEPRQGVTIEKLVSGGVLLLQANEPYQYTCPYCGRSFSVWHPSAGGAGVGIHIKGNVDGNIVIGNGNTFR